MPEATTRTGWTSQDLNPVRVMPSLPLIGLVFLLLLFLRHPGGILHANFWGEDGWVWYPDAYRSGVRTLLLPHSGYLQTTSRLGALLAQLVPLRWAPTIFAAIALLVQLLPPLLLVSHRFDAAWPNYPSRFLFALVYIALPDSFQTFGNLTNSQWYLAILAFLVVAGAPPRGIAGQLGDCGALILSGLSGPFCLMLLPVAAWVWSRDRCPARLLRLALILATAAIQAAELLRTMGQTRPDGPLGLGLGNLAHIIAMKIVYGLILGSHVMGRLARSHLWAGDAVSGVIALAAAGVIGLAFWRGSLPFRCFAVFGGLVMAACLFSPVLTTGAPAWVVLATPFGGQRYFLIPMLVLAASFVSLAADRQRAISTLGLGLCLAMGVGLLGDWPYPHRPGTDFDRLARVFSTAPTGTRMTFPVWPTGDYSMVLIKE